MSQMRRYVPVLIAGMALVAAGCHDSVAPAKQLTTLVPFGDRSYSSVVDETEGQNAVEVLFDIPAAGGSVRVGEFTLTFDANSVCDPATSGYGPEFWLQDCQTLTTDFPIKARVFTANGESHVEFLPDIRFHPAKNVTATVARPEIRNMSDEHLAAYEVWYTKRVENTRYYIDEAWIDPSLATRFDRVAGEIIRPIRHFSGIVVHIGTDCLENPFDMSCAP